MRFDVIELADILSQWRWGRLLVATTLVGGLWLARVPTTNLIAHQYEDRIATLIGPLATCVDHAGAFDPPKLVCKPGPVPPTLPPSS